MAKVQKGKEIEVQLYAVLGIYLTGKMVNIKKDLYI
jgi:hypothetical protein